ncbi:MAG: hypothetical protein ACHQQ3_05870, partial [Gemmatimonadales bacterium]
MSAMPGAWHARRFGRRAVAAVRRYSPRGVILVYHRVAGPRRDPQWLDVRKGNFGAQLDQLLQSARTLPLGEFEARR